MTTEQETTGTDNQGNPAKTGVAEETAKASAEAEKVDSGTTSETGANSSDKTFSDPNMQKAFTQKMQEIAEQRKQLETERESYQKVNNIYNRIESDPDIVNYIKKKWGAPVEEDNISSEELTAAQSDPDKMRELIRKEAQSLVNPISSKIKEMEFENTLSNYASAEGNEDFWQLDKSDLIEPELNLLRKKNPNASNEQIIKAAHQKARLIVNTISDNIKKQEKERIDGTLAKKKESIIDKGGKSNISSLPSFKGKTLTETYEILRKGKGEK